MLIRVRAIHQMTAHPGSSFYSRIGIKTKACPEELPQSFAGNGVMETHLVSFHDGEKEFIHHFRLFKSDLQIEVEITPKHLLRTKIYNEDPELHFAKFHCVNIYLKIKNLFNKELILEEQHGMRHGEILEMFEVLREGNVKPNETRDLIMNVYAMNYREGYFENPEPRPRSIVSIGGIESGSDTESGSDPGVESDDETLSEDVYGLSSPGR